MGLIRSIYGVPDTLLKGTYDLVVPMDYGTLRGKARSVLPKAGIAGVREAARLVASGTATQISWAETDKFGTPLETTVTEKLRVLAEYNLDERVVSAMIHTVVNSIQEVEAIIEANPMAKKIVVICDWRHYQRLRKIWSHFFGGEIAWIFTAENWDEDHPSRFCRSNNRWFLGNVAHHLILSIRGVEAMRGLAQTNFARPE